MSKEIPVHVRQSVKLKVKIFGEEGAYFQTIEIKQCLELFFIIFPEDAVCGISA